MIKLKWCNNFTRLSDTPTISFSCWIIKLKRNQPYNLVQKNCGGVVAIQSSGWVMERSWSGIFWSLILSHLPASIGFHGAIRDEPATLTMLQTPAQLGLDPNHVWNAGPGFLVNMPLMIFVMPPWSLTLDSSVGWDGKYAEAHPWNCGKRAEMADIYNYRGLNICIKSGLNGITLIVDEHMGLHGNEFLYRHSVLFFSSPGFMVFTSALALVWIRAFVSATKKGVFNAGSLWNTIVPAYTCTLLTLFGYLFSFAFHFGYKNLNRREWYTELRKKE